MSVKLLRWIALAILILMTATLLPSNLYAQPREPIIEGESVEPQAQRGESMIHAEGSIIPYKERVCILSRFIRGDPDIRGPDPLARKEYIPVKPVYDSTAGTTIPSGMSADESEWMV